MNRFIVLVGLILTACTGEIPAFGVQGTRVEIAGDVFMVSTAGETAIARNYATGLFNQARLIENATLAITDLTGCRVTAITQRPMINTYDATLNCGG